MATDHPNPVEPRQLELTKNGQRWVLRYMPGEESSILRWLVSHAGRAESDFDWFDAAVLSHQLGRDIQQQLSDLKSSA